MPRLLTAIVSCLCIVSAPWMSARAQDVSTGNSSAGGDAAANTDIDYTTVPVSGLGAGNPSLGGNWVAGVSPEGRKNVTVDGNNPGVDGGWIEILNGSEVDTVVIGDGTTAESQQDGTATVAINGGIAAPFPELDDDDDGPPEDDFGFTLRDIDDNEPTSGFLLGVDGGTLNAFGANAAKAAVSFGANAPVTHVGLWNGGRITGTVTGHAGQNLLEIGAEVEQGDNVAITTLLTGNVDLGGGTNGLLLESIVAGDANATATLTGNVTGGAGMDYVELTAEGLDASNTGGLSALSTLDGALNLGAGHNLLDVTAEVGHADAHVTVTGATTFGAGDDHLYLFTEFDEGENILAASRGSALVNFRQNIDLGDGANTVILEGEGATEAKARIVLNSAADASGTARSILGGANDDTFFLYEANVAGNLDLNTVSGGTDVVNAVGSAIDGTLTFGTTGGTLNLAGFNTVGTLATNGDLALRRLATDATYLNSGATYADGMGGATIGLSGNLNDAGGNTLTIGTGTTLQLGATTDIADTLHIATENSAAIDFATTGPAADTFASLSGGGKVFLGDTDLTFGGNAPAAYSGPLTGTGDLLFQGGHTFSGGNAFGSLTVNAPGQIVAFTGSNQIGGPIAVQNGTLWLTGTNTFGSALTVDGTLRASAAGLGDYTGLAFGNGSAFQAVGQVPLGNVTWAAGADVTMNTAGGDTRIVGLKLDGNHTLTQAGDGILTFRNLYENAPADLLDLADGSKIRLAASADNADVAGDMNDDTIANTAAGGATVIVEHPDYIPDVDATTITLIRAGAALGTYNATTNTTTVTANQDLSGGGAVATTDEGTLDLRNVQTSVDGPAIFDGGGAVEIGEFIMKNDATLSFPGGTGANFNNGIVADDKDLTLDGTGRATLSAPSRVRKLTVGGSTTLRLGADLAAAQGVAMGDGTKLETSGTRTVTGALNLADNGGGGQTSTTVRGSGTVRVSSLAVQDAQGASLGVARGTTLAASALGAGANPLVVDGGGVFELGSPDALTDSTGYTGPVTVNGGTARVNSNLGGSVAVGADAILTGAGAVGGNADVAGTHEPGNSIATVTVQGNYSLASGATLEIEVDNDGNSDTVAVGGNATLQTGSKIRFVGEDGTRLRTDLTGVRWLTYGNTLTVGGTARAADGSNDAAIDAALATLRDTAILDFTLYVEDGARAVLADVERMVTYSSFATSDNTRAVGWALDNYTGTNAQVFAMLDTIDTLATSAEVTAALAALSPESVVGTPEAAMDVAGAMGERIGLRMADRRQAAWSEGAILPAAVPAEADTGRGLTVWAAPFGTWGDQDRTDGVMGYEWDSRGVTLGLESLVGRSLLGGVSFGYAATDLDGDRYSAVELDTYRLDLYGTWTRERLYVEGGAWYAWHDVDGRRELPFLFSTASYETDADGYGLTLGGGYRFSVGAVDLIPNLTLAWSAFDQDRYTETGAAGANLSVRDVEEDSLTHRLGVDLEHRLRRNLLLTASAAWRHEYCDDRTTLKAAFAGSPTFTTRGGETDADSGLFGLGITGRLQENVGAGIRYGYEVRDDYDAHNLTARIGIAF